MDSKNKLVLCELYYKNIHGYSEQYSDTNIDGHYMVIESFTSLNEESDSDEDQISSIAQLYQAQYILLYNKYKETLRHSLIQNYTNIISKDSYIKPEIAECFYLRGNEYVAVLKTHWLRLVQRTWKKIFETRRQVVQMRKNISSLFYRERTGKWPPECARYPLLKGMLNNLI